jgi:hypothetical protein
MRLVAGAERDDLADLEVRDGAHEHRGVVGVAVRGAE